MAGLKKARRIAAKQAAAVAKPKAARSYQTRVLTPTVPHAESSGQAPADPFVMTTRDLTSKS